MQSQHESTAKVDDAPAGAGEGPAAPAEIAAANAKLRPPAEDFNETLTGLARGLTRREGPGGDPDGRPLLPDAATNGQAEEAADLLGQVWAFHRGDPGAADDLVPPGDDLLPAILQPFRDPGRIRHDYPLFLFAPGSAGDDRLCAPLSDVLKEVAESFAPGPDDARILKDNFPRLERVVHESMFGTCGPVPAADYVAEAGRIVADALALGATSDRSLREDLEKVARALPGGGTLLVLGDHTPLHAFMHAARPRVAARRLALRADVTDLASKLGDLLRVDRAKGTEARRPDTLAGTVGAAGAAHLDPQALARVLGPARGSPPMDSRRRDRIEGVMETLERFLSAEDGPLVFVVHGDDVPPAGRPTDAEWRQAEPDRICHSAAALFDELAATHADLFGAMRIARLELAGAYESPRHDALREAFEWRAFSRQELLRLPPVLAVESARHLAGSGMLDLSRLLLSGRPLEIVVTVQPATNAGFAGGDDPLTGFRFELAYLGVSHREALVHQSSAARPVHLLECFARSLDATRTSLHVIASGLSADGRNPPLGAWLHGGAALEGRAHPLFHYNPEAGETWARRLDFSANPQPESDWPVYELPCRNAAAEDETMTIAFTFADFALMEPCYRDHFRILPPAVTGDELATVDEYLLRPAAETLDRIPFIWAADAKGRLHRLVITRRLAFACRDRLGYWRTLQELSGVRNEYVREAVERERERLEADFAAERAQRAEAHLAELEQAKAGAAGEAMQRLARALLDTDLSALGAVTLTGPAPAEAPTALAPVAAPPTQDPQGPAPEAEVEEAVGFEEPWIDSALCTSCNDCLDINRQLFIYNSNKQAVLGDLSSGTFADLVKAAEKCPAKCIHPGKPLNPDEPNLEELIERAKPFN
ncbi:MAG: ferredoxin [Planctomycetota bacterium]|jgi:ferredoxin